MTLTVISRLLAASEAAGGGMKGSATATAVRWLRQRLPLHRATCCRYASGVTRHVQYENEIRQQYPVLADKVVPIPALRKKYKHLLDGERMKDAQYTICGRVISKRQSGKKLCFYDINDGDDNLQVVAMARDSLDDNFDEIHTCIRRGDIAGFTGYPGLSKTNEFSLFSRKAKLLAPCMHNIPETLSDVELQLNNRSLHLLVNRDLRHALLIRSKVLTALRKFLLARDFLEVETPVLTAQAGGAIARPFWTKANAINRPFALRIAPELYLKKLIVGGLPRVFEIGKVFRNEGLDRTHNPEFTTCELYHAYMTFEDFFTFTEDVLRNIVSAVNGASLEVAAGTHQIDFSQPFRRINFVDGIADATGVRVVDKEGRVLDVETLLALCAKHNISTPAPHTQASLLGNLSEHLLESQCIQPTFLYGHPSCLSPLAKVSPRKPGIVDRFEVFINGKELINAYNGSMSLTYYLELNDPEEQRDRFRQQEANRNMGDDEAHLPDESFCRALEYGMPPTVGWGLGIDRLVMLLCNSANIRDILAFPIKAE